MITSAVSISVSVLLFFVVFFSGWNKEARSVSPDRLVGLALLRNGWLKTAKELNKCAGVVAVSLLGLAALANVEAVTSLLIRVVPFAYTLLGARLDIAWHALLIAGLHVTFSMWNWYQFNPLNVWQHKRWFVIGVGALAFLVLLCSKLVRATGLAADDAILIAFLLGISHLLLFSIDSASGAVDVRPVVRLPLAIAVVVLVNAFWVKVWN